MKPNTYRSLGFNVSILVPESVDENDKLAGKIGATLSDAIDNVVYRSSGGLPTFREELANGIEAATNIKRKTEALREKPTAEETAALQPGKIKTNEDGSEKYKYIESEAEYLDRVLAETGRSIESFQDIADAAASKMVYDPKASEREAAGPKTPPKSVYTIVDQFIANGQADAVAGSLTSILSRTVANDRESLARAVHEDQLNEIRKAKAKKYV